MATITILFI